MCECDSRAAARSAAAAAAASDFLSLSRDLYVQTHSLRAGDGIGRFGQLGVKFCFTTEWVCADENRGKVKFGRNAKKNVTNCRTYVSASKLKKV